MYEIVTEFGAIVAIDWFTWRVYDGERLLCGQPYTGPVMVAENDVDTEESEAA